jgi:GntR family transcriptional regulator
MMAKIGPSASNKQVADVLRQRILNGDYPPGSRLPSTRELEEEFGCSPTTVQRAVRTLKLDGLVEGATGVGVFVRTQRPAMHVTASYVTKVGDQPRASWSSEAERLGMRGSQKLTQVGSVTAPDDVADLLGLEADTTVAVRRRVMLLDDEPVQLADSYYPLGVAQGTELSEPRKMVGGTIAALERMGLELGDFEEHVLSRMPTPDERRELRLSDGVPVLIITRVTCTTDGTPVEVSRALLAADRHVLSYRLPARQ